MASLPEVTADHRLRRQESFRLPGWLEASEAALVAGQVDPDFQRDY